MANVKRRTALKALSAGAMQERDGGAGQGRQNPLRPPWARRPFYSVESQEDQAMVMSLDPIA
jgi:hypothetical protein